MKSGVAGSAASATRPCGGMRIVHHHAAPVRVGIKYGVCLRMTAPGDNPFDEA